MVLLAQEAFIPGGNPIAVPIPVALVVVWVIGVTAVFIHGDGDDEAGPATMSGMTVIVPVAVLLPPGHPPVIVTV